MNGMHRVESDNSVDADEPIMKHMMEGGVTILKQLERKKQVCYRSVDKNLVWRANELVPCHLTINFVPWIWRAIQFVLAKAALKEFFFKYL